MDKLFEAFVGLVGKISDPVVIVLIILLFGSEWLRITQSREERVDRKNFVDALKSITDALEDIKIAIAANTGRIV